MEKTGSVQSVERALSLLEILAAAPDGLRLSALCKAAGLAPSTAHRLLTTLERRGFAQTDPVSLHWQVGRRAFSVGIAFTRWQSLIAAAMPVLRRLRDYSRETVNLGILDEGEVITIAQVESREITRAIAAPGGRTPALNSGMGKAILATWPDAAIEDFIRQRGLRPATRHSLKTSAAVMAEIAQIRGQGFAFDNEEFAYGMRCVAAVVRDSFGEPLAAISISALAQRLPQEALAQMGEHLLESAKGLGTIMGGR